MPGHQEFVRRQRVLSEFGDFVLDHDDLDKILNEACRLVAAALDVDLAKVIEIEAGAVTGLVRAGVGWNAGIVGHERVDLNERSSEAFAIRDTVPVITNDIAHEERFEFPPFLHDHGVVALANVPILLPGRIPYGILQVDARERRAFDQEDIEFLKTYAMVLGPVIDRLMTAAAFRETDERLRLIGQNALAYVMIVTDVNDRITDWMGGSEAILGWSKAEATGKTADMIFTDEDRAAGVPRCELEEARRHGTVADVRWHRRKDGTRVFLDGQTIALTDRTGRHRGYFKIGQDVTGRARAETALRESEERLRQFGDASQDILWMRDAATLQWRYLTPAFETIYGLDRQDALRGNNFANWLDLIVPEDRERAVEAIERVRGGEHVTFDYRIRRPSDGCIRWLRNTDFPIEGEDGEAAVIGGVGHDLTELREAELRLQTLMEGMPQLVWRAGGEGDWTWASPQWTEYTGLSMPQSIGSGWLDSFHPDDRAAARRAWHEAAAGGHLDVEARIRHALTGRYRWFQTRASPVRAEDGTIAEWLGTSTDVDDLRRLRDRQQLLVAELQHRVRNILTIVRSVFTRTIEAEGPVDQMVEHFRGRLDNLARTQVVVTQSAGGSVDLRSMIFDELLSVGFAESPNVSIDGPEVALDSRTAESISLAIHELTTNAVKYGALKFSEASLSIRWQTNVNYGDTPTLHLTWAEQGVPMVPLPPSRHGFGRELIEEALPYRLGAETKLDFRGGGVRCTISVPLPDRGALAVPWETR